MIDRCSVHRFVREAAEFGVSCSDPMDSACGADAARRSGPTRPRRADLTRMLTVDIGATILRDQILQIGRSQVWKHLAVFCRHRRPTELFFGVQSAAQLALESR